METPLTGRSTGTNTHLPARLRPANVQQSMASPTDKHSRPRHGEKKTTLHTQQLRHVAVITIGLAMLNRLVDEGDALRELTSHCKSLS